MSELRKFLGSCHCQNIRYTLAWPSDETDIAVRECSCSFCRKHAGSWTSHQYARLVVNITRGEFATRYQFGSRTADFLICKQCGVVPLVISEIDGRCYAVVNTNSFDENSGFALSRSSTNFDGEGTEDRLARRKRNWIQHVSVSIAD